MGEKLEAVLKPGSREAMYEAALLIRKVIDLGGAEIKNHGCGPKIELHGYVESIVPQVINAKVKDFIEDILLRNFYTLASNKSFNETERFKNEPIFEDYNRVPKLHESGTSTYVKCDAQIHNMISVAREKEFINLLDKCGIQRPTDNTSWGLFTDLFGLPDQIKNQLFPIVSEKVSEVQGLTKAERNKIILERMKNGNPIFKEGQIVAVHGNYFMKRSQLWDGFEIVGIAIKDERPIVVVKSEKYLKPFEVNAEELWYSNPLIEMQM